MNLTEQVNRQERDRRRIERQGIDAARKVGFRVQASVLRAVKARRPWVRALRNTLEDLVPVTRDAMLTGHLTGMIAAKAVQPVTVAAYAGDPPPRSTVFRSGLEFFQRRLALSRRDLLNLERQYELEVLRVLKAASDKIERDLQKTLQESFEAGEHIRDGVARVREAFEKNGLTPDNSYTFENIFRTQTALAYAAGRMDANSDPDIQEILWGYRYSTVGDDRVRPEHQGFEGVTLPKDDPFWKTSYPPNGYSCRCVALELFDELKPVGPKTVDVDGRKVPPSVDPGFAINPGQLFSLMRK